MKKLVLVNDDGIDAEGIYALAKALVDTYDVRIVAPAMQQSGMSQAMTADDKLVVEEVKWDIPVQAHRVYGTPADCAKIALEVLYKDDLPDIVLSGINNGNNLGTDVLYSGTIGGATEGFMHNISAIAVSRLSTSTLDFDEVAQRFSKLLPKLDLVKPCIYNVNFPKRIADDNDCFRYTSQGKRTYQNGFTKGIDENGKTYYILDGTPRDPGNVEGSDVWAMKHSFVSITPLNLDRTDEKLLEQLRSDKSVL